MREIKFRAWNEYLKEMYELEKVNYLGSTGISDTCVGCDKAVWMQYTGLKDKNGIEIYEGDIIEDLDEERHVVTFKNGGFGREGRFLINYNTGECIVTHEPLINSVIDVCKVIGNIYENKELLEGI